MSRVEVRLFLYLDDEVSHGIHEQIRICLDKLFVHAGLPHQVLVVGTQRGRFASEFEELVLGRWRVLVGCVLWLAASLFMLALIGRRLI